MTIRSGINTSLAYRLQCGTTCNVAPPATPHRKLNPKWPTGSGNRSNLRLLDPPNNFRKISFFDSIIPSMRTSEIQNGCQGSQNGQRGLEGGLPLGLWVLPSTLAK